MRVKRKIYRNKGEIAMPYEQVRTIMGRAQRFHRKLSEFYQKLDETTPEEQERMKLVLQYLQEHENKLERQLCDFEKDARPNAMDTWVQFPPDEDLEKIFDPSRLKPDMSINDIVVLTLEFDNTLLKFYERARDVASTREIGEMFDQLLVEGKRDRKALVQYVFGFDC